MTAQATAHGRRILVIDDNRAIHEDFRKILAPKAAPGRLDELEASLFGNRPCADGDLASVGALKRQPPGETLTTFATQGQEGVRLAAEAVADGRAFSVAFIDMRMPPGWDGLQTTLELWKVSPDTQVVICTAYSDYRWDDLLTNLGHSDQLVILKKPFDPIEVLQLANALAEKWRLAQAYRLRLAGLEAAIQSRTADLEATNARLREEIAERVRTEHELAGARDHAIDADRAKSAFLANMSHEIRTPMNGVIGMASLLLETELADEQRDYVNTIVQSGESLLHIVNDILDFSKIEAGRLNLQSIEFLLHELIETTLGIARDLARDTTLELDWEIATGVPHAVVGDPVRIRQVLLNLVGNAIKFTPAGKVSLRVANLSPGARHATLRFTIADTGIGISPEVLPSLFRPFTQADVSTTRRFGGTGLGLAISKRIAELMNGSISAQSRPGVGSTFTFTLPVPVVAATGRPEETQGTSHHPRQPPMRTGADILVVEDNPVNQKVALRQLKMLGMQADLAGNGREALAALERHPYQIILMDVQMPEMDGFTASRRIREAQADGNPPPPANLRIIAMTAHAMPHDREACLAAGMDDYLAKPFRLQDLREVLERNIAALRDRSPGPAAA